MKIKAIIKKHRIAIGGTIAGAAAGYTWYHYVGCTTGTCPITSSPYISTMYGALMGYLFFSMFRKKEKKDEDS